MKKKVLCLLPSTVGHPDYCPRRSNRPSPHRFSDFQFSFQLFPLHPSSLPPDSQRRFGGGAALRGVAVCEEFIEGAKEGIQFALRIFPYLVAILVAVGIFRAAGGIDILTRILSPLLDLIGLPAQVLPLVLVRPLSGSAATGLFAEIVKACGPDSYAAQLAGTILGGTETTLYVLAVYFGSVAIRKGRHALAAGLLADAAGVAASLVICRLIFK